MARSEPWLRQELSPLDPIRAQIQFSFEQALEDVEFFTRGLSDDDLNRSLLGGLPSIAFHIVHIVGSIDRLITYATGAPLSTAQLKVLHEETTYQGSRDKLTGMLQEGLTAGILRITGIDPDSYTEPRFVGRQRIQTTVGNLLVHIAEHTQRHVGQLITTAKFIAAGKNRDLR